MDLLKLQTEIAEENGFNTWEQMIDCFCTTDPGKRVINENVNKLIERAVANADTGDRQLTIPDVNNRYLETTNEYERLKVEIYKDLLVELYDFAYQQAKKTDSVDELLDIDRRINGC